MPLKYQQTTATGSYSLISGGITGNSTVRSGYHSLDQSVSNTPGDDHPFASSHQVISGSILNNHAPDFWANFFNCPSAFYDFQTGFLDPVFPPASQIARLVGNTNPANPEMTLPNIIWELRDLPDMIRQGGRIADALRRKQPWKRLIRPKSAARDLAAANLAIQFGWMPFVRDLISIVGVQSSIDKTKAKLNKLKSGKGMRIGAKLGSASDSFTTPHVLWSVAWYKAEEVTVKRTTESWGVVRWKPQSSFVFPSSDAEFTRRALGLSLDSVPLNVWESLPWSWLIDYFTDVGSLLKAGNHVVAYPASGVAMTRYQATATHNAGRDAWHTWSGGSMQSWMNTRVTINDSFPPGSFLGRMPVLSGSQLSILGSLAIARAR